MMHTLADWCYGIGLSLAAAVVFGVYCWLILTDRLR